MRAVATESAAANAVSACAIRVRPFATLSLAPFTAVHSSLLIIVEKSLALIYTKTNNADMYA